ncbi:MAG TPA: SpoIIE family protein phosphatase, partial [bacterium]|nr:SpoIIE family protein phosphatase [bacterium]
ELKVVTLTAQLAALKTANTNVTNAYTAVSNARIARNKTLYKDKTGLYDPNRRINIETRQYTKDKRILWVEISAKFLRNEKGEPVAAQGSTRDISHRKQVEQERDKFAEDLTAARLVQQEIIPQRSPSSELVEIAFRYLPMEEVGGDYFTFVDFREHDSLGVFIGDVSGHGVPAALYTMTVKAVTDRLFRKYNLNPSRFMEVLNNEMDLCGTWNRNGPFLFCFRFSVLNSIFLSEYIYVKCCMMLRQLLRCH